MDFGTLYFISQNGGNNDRWNVKMNVDFVKSLKVKRQPYNGNINLKSNWLCPREPSERVIKTGTPLFTLGYKTCELIIFIPD
jgi:hypothetical protein